MVYRPFTWTACLILSGTFLSIAAASEGRAAAPKSTAGKASASAEAIQSLKVQAVMKFMRKDSDGAIDLLNQVLSRNPADAEALVRRGSIKIDAGYFAPGKADLKRAVPLLNKKIETRPGEAVWFELRANAYRGLGELPLALKDVREAVALDPHQKLWDLELQMLETMIGLNQVLGKPNSSGGAEELTSPEPGAPGVPGFPLMKMLNDSDWIVRRDAAIAAGDTAEPGYVPALKKLAADPRPEVREAANKSLLLLGPVAP